MTTEAETRELVVERQGAGEWAVWDSATSAWETIGKEADAIKTARDRAKKHGAPARMRVLNMSREVKYERRYNDRKRAGQPQAPVPPPLPGEEPEQPQAADPNPEPDVAVEEFAVSATIADVGSEVAEAIAPKLEFGMPWAEDGSPNGGSTSLVFVTLSDGRAAALDPAGVAVIEEVGDVVKITMSSGASVIVRGEFWATLQLVSSGRTS